MKISRKLFDLDRYFDDMYCAESFNFIHKDEILAKIKSRYPDKQVIIGDRFHDIQTGLKNNIESIWCEYGYGKAVEAEGSTFKIKDIKRLLEYL